MPRGPSINAKRAAQILIKEIKTGKDGKVVLAKILKEVGYSDEIANNPQKVTTQKTFIETLEEAGLTDDRISQVHDELLKASRIEKFYFDIGTSGKEKITEKDGVKPLFKDAAQIVIEEGKASISLLQRKLKIGYSNAAKLMDMLKEKEIVSEGGEVLVEEMGSFEDEESEPEDMIPAASITDDQVREVIEAIPGCKLLFVNRFRSRWGTIEVIYQAPDSLTRKAALELAYKAKRHLVDTTLLLGKITHTHEYTVTDERKKELRDILDDNK